MEGRVADEAGFDKYCEFVDNEFLQVLETTTSPIPSPIAELLKQGGQPSIANSSRCEGIIELVTHGSKIQPLVNSLCRRIAATSDSITASEAKTKCIIRIVEKVTYESEASKRGSVKFVMDVARGSVTCASMEAVVLAMRVLLEEHRAGRILLTRMKDRFRQPTPAGWADAMVNAVFCDDRTYHVFELQIYHKDMLTVRSQMGGHREYATLRAGSEILCFLNLNPVSVAQAIEQETAETGLTLGDSPRCGNVNVSSQTLHEL